MTIQPLLKRLFVITILIFLGGCATHVSNLSGEMNPQVAAGQVSLPEGAVISIQFPLAVAPDAQRQLQAQYACHYNDFVNHPFSSCGHPSFSDRALPMLAEHSGYYAAELKTLLGRYVDESAVRLEPFTLDYQEGQFVQRPLLPGTSPSVLIIELYELPSALDETIGSGYTPTLNIRSAGSQSVATCGHLLIVAGHHKFYPPAGDCRQLGTRQVSAFAPLHYYSDKTVEVVDFPKQGKRLQPGTVTTSTALWEKNDDAYLTASSEDGFVVTVDTIRNETSDWIARMAVHALSLLDLDDVYRQGMMDYARLFDPALADRVRSQGLEDGDARRLAIIQKLLLVENDWLAAQDASIQEAMLNGNYGKSFRQSRRLLADGYRKSQSLGMMQVGAALMAGFGSGLFGGVQVYDPGLLVSQVMANEAHFAQKQQDLTQALMAHLAPGVELRNKVMTVTIEGVQASISGTAQTEIHQQLQALYTKLKG